MTIDPVEKIANAVLYEGYILYPYRASAVKNRQRFNFGSLYPSAHCRAQTGADSDTMEIECLISGDEAAGATIEARVRFLHLQSREVYRLASPAVASDGSPAPNDSRCEEPKYEMIDSLVVDGHLHQTWQEAVERDVVVSDLALANLAAHPVIHNFSLPGSRLVEQLADADESVVGRIVRRQQEITGAVTLSAERLSRDVFKLRVVVKNTTTIAEQGLPGSGPAAPALAERGLAELGLTEPPLASRDEVLLSTFISTHAMLRVAGGEFVSLLEPPDALRSAASACRNVGAWPVLAGEPGQRDRLLASPIILYDYPQVAPESSGDWCDGAEIDEMLVLRVMTLTGDEKRAMRDVDRRARDILERTESLTEEQMLKLHGAFRGLDRRSAALSGEETPL